VYATKDTPETENYGTDNFSLTMYEDLSNFLHRLKCYWKYRATHFDHFARLSMNILFVTEDASYRLLVRKYLADEGYTLFLANDVREGMRTVRVKNIDLVISDLALKYMDGIDFCDQARKILGGKAIPFILISIYDDEITRVKVQTLKNTGFLKKGRPLSELITMIHQLMGRQQQGSTPLLLP
jgi:DNA-binding response OmpR family regulator